MSLDLQKLVNQAMMDDRLVGMQPIVEKEILHYEILHALSEGGFLDRLVFQGGTALRLCHGAVRFSEDLDFAGGTEFNSSDMTALDDHLTAWLTGRYGLETIVKPPRKRKDPVASGLVTAKWRITIVTQPETPRLPRQRIHLEICNVPSYESELMPLQGNYTFQQVSQNGMKLQVETKREILADKLIAFPASLESHARWRDLWDLHWLRREQVEADTGMVQKKVGDYGIDNFDDRLDAVIKRIPELVESRDFVDQLGRFLNRQTVERTVRVAAWRDSLAWELQGLFQLLQQELANGQDLASPSEFHSDDSYIERRATQPVQQEIG